MPKWHKENVSEKMEVRFEEAWFVSELSEGVDLSIPPFSTHFRSYRLLPQKLDDKTQCLKGFEQLKNATRLESILGLALSCLHDSRKWDTDELETYFDAYRKVNHSKSLSDSGLVV